MADQLREKVAASGRAGRGDRGAGRGAALRGRELRHRGAHAGALHGARPGGGAARDRARAQARRAVPVPRARARGRARAWRSGRTACTGPGTRSATAATATATRSRRSRPRRSAVERAERGAIPKAVPTRPARCSGACVPFRPSVSRRVRVAPRHRRHAGHRGARTGRHPRRRPGLLPGERGRELHRHRLHAQRQGQLQPRQPGRGTAHGRRRREPARPRLRAPDRPLTQRAFSLEARDATNPANVATITPLATRFRVRVVPVGGNPARRRRIRARGFTEGRTLYMHVRKGRRKIRTPGWDGSSGPAAPRSSAASGSSGAATKPGVYRVQFDARRRYSRRAFPREVYRVTIFPTFGVSVAGPAFTSGHRWVRDPLDQTSTSGYRVRRCSAIASRTARRSSAEAIR